MGLVIGSERRVAAPGRGVSLEQFDRRGHLTLPAVFSADEIRRLDEQLGDLVGGGDLDGDRVIVEPGSEEIRSIFAFHEMPRQARRKVA